MANRIEIIPLNDHKIALKTRDLNLEIIELEGQIEIRSLEDSKNIKVRENLFGEPDQTEKIIRSVEILEETEYALRDSSSKSD